MTLDDYFNVHSRIHHAWIAFLNRNRPAGVPENHLGIRALGICYFIWKHPNCMLNEVADAVANCRATTSLLVDSLCREQLLNREQCKTDRRRICLSVREGIRDFLFSLEAELTTLPPLPPAEKITLPRPKGGGGSAGCCPPPRSRSRN